MLGVAEVGNQLAAEVEAAIAGATVDISTVNDQLRVLPLYLRGSAAQLVLGTDANTHWLIEAAGGISLSGILGFTENTPISAEAILKAAPDVIVVTELGLESVGGIDGLLEIGSLSQTPAGRQRHILAYDAQLLLGNGPRTGELLARMARDLASIASESDS